VLGDDVRKLLDRGEGGDLWNFPPMGSTEGMEGGRLRESR